MGPIRSGYIRAVPDVGSARDLVAASPPLAAHSAVIVEDDTHFLDEVLPFVRGALEQQGKVAVNLRAERVELLRDRLGADATAVSWSDTHAWEPHPVRRLRAIESLLASRTSRSPLHFVGECAFPPGPPPLISEWLRFDALLNESIASSGAEMLCVYDRRSLPGNVLEHALHSHPYLGGTRRRQNAGYRSIAEMALETVGTLEIPRRVRRILGRPSPAEARAFVTGVLHGGKTVVAEDELQLIVTELVSNALLAGAETVSVAAWEADGLLCVQVDDDGAGLKDPLVGYRLPPAKARHGRGLFIVRHLAEATEIRSSPEGTSVRVYLGSSEIPRARSKSTVQLADPS